MPNLWLRTFSKTIVLCLVIVYVASGQFIHKIHSNFVLKNLNSQLIYIRKYILKYFMVIFFMLNDKLEYFKIVNSQPLHFNA